MSYLKWTKEAAYCFERNMICKGCTNEYICNRYKKPPMKKVVLSLFKQLGKPEILKEKTTKICPRCGIEKDLKLFVSSNAYCGECYKEYQKEWRMKNKNEKLYNN